MPLYEFTCKKCSENFTVRVSISEKDSVKCPQCSSSELQQKYSAEFLIPSKGNDCGAPPNSAFG